MSYVKSMLCSLELESGKLLNGWHKWGRRHALPVRSQWFWRQIWVVGTLVRVAATYIVKMWLSSMHFWLKLWGCLMMRSNLMFSSLSSKYTDQVSWKHLVIWLFSSQRSCSSSRTLATNICSARLTKRGQQLRFYIFSTY